MTAAPNHAHALVHRLCEHETCLHEHQTSLWPRSCSRVTASGSLPFKATGPTAALFLKTGGGRLQQVATRQDRDATQQGGALSCCSICRGHLYLADVVQPVGPHQRRVCHVGGHLPQRPQVVQQVVDVLVPYLLGGWGGSGTRAGTTGVSLACATAYDRLHADAACTPCRPHCQPPP